MKDIAEKENSVKLQLSHAQGLSTRDKDKHYLNKPILAVVPWMNYLSQGGCVLWEESYD